MKVSALFFLLLFSTISFSQETPIQSPRIVVKVPLGESITLEGHTVKFIKVLEDSRCPKNTNCIWEGRAKILVEISSDEMDAIQKELIFGKVNPGESDDLTLFSSNEKNIKAIVLDPYPSSEDTTDSKNYVLLINVKN